MSQTTNSWLTGLQDVASKVFNDPDALYTLLDRGLMFGNNVVDDGPTDVLAAMKNTMYASAIRTVCMSAEDRDYTSLETGESRDVRRLTLP